MTAILHNAVEFALRKLVEYDLHASDPARPSRNTSAAGRLDRVPSLIAHQSALRFLSPDMGILIRRQCVETFEQALGETGPLPGFQLEDRSRTVGPDTT